MSEAPRWVVNSLEDLDAYTAADLEDAERERDRVYARVLELRGAVKALRELSAASCGKAAGLTGYRFNAPGTVYR